MGSTMKPLLLIFALALGSAGCAHQQLTNRQIAYGVIGAAAVTLIVVMLVTQCDDTGDDCNFQ